MDALNFSTLCVAPSERADYSADINRVHFGNLDVQGMDVSRLDARMSQFHLGSALLHKSSWTRDAPTPDAAMQLCSCSHGHRCSRHDPLAQALEAMHLGRHQTAAVGSRSTSSRWRALVS